MAKTIRNETPKDKIKLKYKRKRSSKIRIYEVLEPQEPDLDLTRYHHLANQLNKEVY